MTFREVRLKIHYTRRQHQRLHRLFFTSPAETKFVQIMGGKALTLKFIRSRKNKFPLTVFISMGRTLRREFMERELRVGAYFIDFAFVTKYAKKGVEIDGRNFHRDIIKEQERDDYLAERGFDILHIEASELWQNPASVKSRVKKFLAK